VGQRRPLPGTQCRNPPKRGAGRVVVAAAVIDSSLENDAPLRFGYAEYSRGRPASAELPARRLIV